MKDNYLGVLLEDMQSQMQRLAEALADVPATVRKLDADMQEVKSELRFMKKWWYDHEHRIKALEDT